MSALISKVVKEFKGVKIYNGANTHPGSRTTTLVVFKEDVKDGIGTARFKYERYNSTSFTKALLEATAYINDSQNKMTNKS